MSSAHDLSDGGLAVGLAESVLRHGVGAVVTLPGDDPFVTLFSESTARAVVSVPARWGPSFVAMAGAVGVPCTYLGVTVEGTLMIDDVFTVAISRLRDAWTQTLPAALA